ncbi:hypothetical protein MOA67_gp050 [Klebsiella phage KpLz-2_45]|uniref:hypothetical protein n=1 Tax=Klebsiella phage KpLz-2_45 TaxID=2698923 RepID=UPI001F1471A5|nr:hypothetical protein MOA67_gp050 [Klebsiella phage KpLz-2_45]UKS71916.1 hypothetical protein KpLz245_0500 [Klebsiella phage KpLz-2_45]
MKRIQSIKVLGTFNESAMLHYSAFIANNLMKGKTVKVYGDPRTRAKFKEVITDYLGPKLIASIKVIPLPNTLAMAQRINRGQVDCACLFISSEGKFFPTLKESLTPVRSMSALFVDAVIC